MSVKMLAIISNEQTPYRLHLHRRIVRELPEVELWSLFTHEGSSSPWHWEDDASIRPVLFGAGESTTERLTPRVLLREWRKGGRITRFLDAHEANFVIILGYNDPARLRVLHWCHARNIPCYLFGDSNVLADKASGLRRWIKNIYLAWVARTATGLLYCGRLGREYFLRYGALPERIHPFPYEPDYATVAKAGAPEALAAVVRFGLRPERRRLLFVGRMVPAKCPDLLLEAFAVIADTRPEWDLVFAGDGPLRTKLQDSVPGHLRDRVCLTGFVQSHEELAGLYAACDVFVLPSDYEPWGVVLAEAATRLAVIASSVVGSAADLVRAGINGRTFEPRNLPSLVDALLGITAHDEWLRMKVESPRVLAAWRAETDPLRTLRRLLEANRVCTPA